MTTYQLKEVIHSKYNINTVARYQRAILFLIHTTLSEEDALFEIDRISRHTASLRCKTRLCHHRLVIEHNTSKFPEILTDLGNSNTSEFVLDSNPSNFLFLPDIFC